MILFFTLLVSFFETELHHMKSVLSLFAHCHHHTVVNITVCCPERLGMKSFECCLLSNKLFSIWLCFHQMIHLWMVHWGNIVLLTLVFLDVAKFTITPLSLLILCKLLFPMVVLKMPSLPTATTKKSWAHHMLTSACWSVRGSRGSRYIYHVFEWPETITVS
jgi:hypothetical protein